MQTEPWLERDKAMIDMLKSIGIEKGKPFNPDAKTQEILKRQPARPMPGSKRYEAVFTPLLRRQPLGVAGIARSGSKAMATASPKPDTYPIDGRGVAYSLAFFSAKHLGAGQFYLMTIKDKGGQRARWRQRPIA